MRGGRFFGFADGGYDDGYGAYAYDGDYCMRRFRTYDASTGTYIGYDGLPHSCP